MARVSGLTIFIAIEFRSRMEGAHSRGTAGRYCQLATCVQKIGRVPAWTHTRTERAIGVGQRCAVWVAFVIVVIVDCRRILAETVTPSCSGQTARIAGRIGCKCRRQTAGCVCCHLEGVSRAGILKLVA
jgi:hypothetical protein